MSLEQARDLLPLAARDLIATIAAREDFEPMLEPLARRRAAWYANPRAARVDELYWPALASVLASVGVAEWMPMSALIENGVTLEGGAKGLRGLFTKAPSEKERRKVLRTATLAARVMEIVVSGGAGLTHDEQRLIAMAMSSFGLTAEELDKTRPPGPIGFESLEIFGELEAQTRRDLVRGAWQLALASKLEPARELNVRGIAARLEVSADADQLRSEVTHQQTRQGEMATVAIELARAPARLLPAEISRPWIEHLVTCAAPVARKAELTARALSNGAADFSAMPKLDAPRRRQAAALALTTLLGHDPRLASALYLRVELRAAAIDAGVGSEIGDAFTIVDRFFFDRVRDAVTASREAAQQPAPGLPDAKAATDTKPTAAKPIADTKPVADSRPAIEEKPKGT